MRRDLKGGQGVCGNGKLPKVMRKPAGVLLCGDFPGPCFMTCTKPRALSSCNPAVFSIFQTDFCTWYSFESTKVQSDGEHWAIRSFRAGRRAPHNASSSRNDSRSPKLHCSPPHPLEPACVSVLWATVTGLLLQLLPLCVTYSGMGYVWVKTKKPAEKGHQGWLCLPW